MKKKVRLALLVLTGALAYFASAGTSGAWCEPQCTENCCTNQYCIDYCW